MLESTLVRNIRRAMAVRGCWTMKVHGSAYTGGIPDILACYRGLFIALEVKVETGKEPSKLQGRTIEEIRCAGGYSACIYSVKEALHVLDIIERGRGDDGVRDSGLPS